MAVSSRNGNWGARLIDGAWIGTGSKMETERGLPNRLQMSPCCVLLGPVPIFSQRRLAKQCRLLGPPVPPPESKQVPVSPVGVDGLELSVSGTCLRSLGLYELSIDCLGCECFGPLLHKVYRVNQFVQKSGNHCVGKPKSLLSKVEVNILIPNFAKGSTEIL